MKTPLSPKEGFLKILPGILIYILLFFTLQCSAQNLLQYPQSIVCDMSRNRYILSNVLSTDLVAIDLQGNQSYFVRNSQINLGMVIYNNVLYGTGSHDRRLRGYNLETGTLVLNVDFSPAVQTYAVTADTSGNLYITQPTANGKIYKYSLRDSVASTFMSGIPAPDGIVYDKLKNRLVYDTYGVIYHPIKAIDLSNLTLTNLKNTNLANTWCITKDEYGRFYVQDSNTNIYRFDSSFTAPPELFYHSTCPGGGMVFIDYDSIRNVIAITLSDINSWTTIPVYPPSSVKEITDIIPKKFELFQNYPNPFNPSTKIKFSVPFVGTGLDPTVRLTIYDVLGQETAVLVNQKLQPGEYEVSFSVEQNIILTSGVYFYRLEAGNYIQTKKMILLK